MKDSIFMSPVVFIAGPTASGKSKWALDIAQANGGEIINADALQVYRDLDILSARPSASELELVPHHLFGFVDGSVRYSVGKWVSDVVPIIIDVLARGKLPILVGGTGLYFKALTSGLATIPEPSKEGTEYADKLLKAGIDILRAEAERLDPVATARILGNDPQRLLRVVSIAKGTEHPLSEWQQHTRPVIPANYWRGAVLSPSRDNLYSRINDRFEHMITDGGLEEAKAIAKRGLSADLPVMKAVGLPPLLSYLRDEMSLDEAVELAKRDTRRFAKRQYTWFRGQTPDWTFVTSDNDKSNFVSFDPISIN